VTTESIEQTRETLAEIREKFHEELEKRPGF